MNPVIRFRSTLFSVADEPENPINPIPGLSIQEWLRTRMPPANPMSPPAAEDWGWYSHVEWGGRIYLVGSCAQESSDGNHEWVLQIEKRRSFKERLLGRGKLPADDPCFAFIRDLIVREAAFTDVSVEA